MLFLPSFNNLIPEYNPVDVVSKIVDKIDINPTIATYKDTGREAYHPKMLLKIIIYAYLA